MPAIDHMFHRCLKIFFARAINDEPGGFPLAALADA